MIIQSAAPLTPVLPSLAGPPGPDRNSLLTALGERVRTLRAKKGVTRKVLALASGVSERHLANLELGMGNASVLVLAQIAQALGSPLVDLVTDETNATPERMLLNALLDGRTDAQLAQARQLLAALFKRAAQSGMAVPGPLVALPAPQRRIALVGLRGAGKSTLGQLLADELQLPFVELNREIERVAGCSLDEIQSLLGQAAYRRYERRALDEVVAQYPEAVIATPGGMVSDSATYQTLLSECLTIWLQAQPQEHMQRVVKQGDLRPMAGNKEAMEDLERILQSRAPMYGKADARLDTSGLAVGEALVRLLELVQPRRVVPI